MVVRVALVVALRGRDGWEELGSDYHG